MPGADADEARLERQTVHRAHALVMVHVAGTHSQVVHLLHGEDAWLSTKPRSARAVTVWASCASRRAIWSSSVARNGHTCLSHRVALRHQALHGHMLWSSILAKVANPWLHLSLSSAEVLHRHRMHARIVVPSWHALEHRRVRMLLIVHSAEHFVCSAHLLVMVLP